ncbi:serine hydrolase domain-containing protein [Aquabacter spiritensis]|uniref:CubicO group peptidase (Beta-lactamase class C family) n=1 Tax=Aquabacter spiritensis TaxID=933073 RepID=A0A4R3LK45_9HYPH|nr:serine hydrolase domain-containing protein [Aquabacter spiritensis]TCT00554.1 CubicO group peptidase (beta-lactamase class C family) [Aquabacter spiritensis]
MLRALVKSLVTPLALVLASGASAQAPAADADLAAKVLGLVPKLEQEVARGMKMFDVPGVAVGIVADDRLVYAKGFGARVKDGSEPPDPATVFQIGSTTKAFLATTMAITAEMGKFTWDQRIETLAPDFRLQDPWVTREMRMFDIIAQRSGLPPYANDGLTALGYDADALIGSLRGVTPASSFRSTFTYTNITHLVAGRIVARLRGEPDWTAVVRKDIVAPLGMADTSFTAEAIASAPNHAIGSRYTPSGSVEVPFDPSFPYLLGPAGNMNSTVEDAARWLRLQIGDGMFEGRRIVPAAQLAITRTPRIGINATTAYAMGWVISSTPNGRIVWHNGGTVGFGAHIGFLPDRGLGVIVLSNQDNQGFPDALAMGIYDAVLGNPTVDHFAPAAVRAKAGYEDEAKTYQRRPDAAPPPPLAAFAGGYASPILGEADVAVDGESLVVTVARTGARLRLTPFDGPAFTVRLIAEGRFAPIVRMSGDTPTGFAQFEVGAAGTVARLNWIYNETQSYGFQRK